MKKFLALCAFVACVAVAGTAASAPIIIGTAANVTGISDLAVAGGTYDVSFSPSSYDATFTSTPPTFLNNNAGATAAAQAITSLFLAQSVTGINGTNCNTKPAGITGYYHCFVVVPNALAGGSVSLAFADHFISPDNNVTNWFSAGAGSMGLPTSQTQGLLTGSPNYVTGSGGYTAFAVFTRVDTASVPEPTSMLLLSTGLVGIATRLRRRQ